MKIKIANLSIGHHSMDFTGKVEELQLEAPLCGNFNLSIEIEKSVHQLVLGATAGMSTHLVCDRCGIDFEKPISFTYNMVYLYKEPVAEFDDPNVTYITSETDTIDITKDLYDYAMLSIPMKNLCKEDCKGLCPQCGADLNIAACNCKPEETGKNSPFADLKKLLNSN